MNASVDRQTKELIHSMVDAIAKKEFLRLQEYAETNEHGLALEHLCDVLHELKVDFASAVIDTIEELGRAMQMEPAIWRRLTADKYPGEPG